MQQNILIVDDDEYMRDLIKSVMEEERYAFSEVENGRKALEIMEDQRVDLIILDLMMTGMSGFQVIEKVRAHPRLSHIPIMVHSVLEDTGTIEQALTLGANDYFTKPLSEADQKFQIPLKVKNLLAIQSAEALLVLLQIAGAAAHELNQPLEVIIGYVDLILARTKGKAPHYEEMEIIREQAQKMADIIKKLQMIRRYETKPYLLGIEILDIDKSAEAL